VDFFPKDREWDGAGGRRKGRGREEEGGQSALTLIEFVTLSNDGECFKQLEGEEEPTLIGNITRLVRGMGRREEEGGGRKEEREDGGRKERKEGGAI
jgi:hypothetical protein